MSHAVISETINDVRGDRLGETVQAVQQNAALARFQFRTKNEWINALPQTKEELHGHRSSKVKRLCRPAVNDLGVPLSIRCCNPYCRPARMVR